MVNGASPDYKGSMMENKSLGPDQAEEAAGVLRGVLPLDAFSAAIRPGARLIGIDVGSKTLGLALSDVSRMIASALETIRRTKFKTDAERLLGLARTLGVGGFVVGLPINLDGSQGPRAQASRAFARNVAALTDAPILLWDERLSTVEAERMLIEADTSRRRRAEVIDKLAATLILQGALDRMRNLHATSD
ncbi:MAG: Holliday junction resolvase RuvX [Hyphomicrobiaceae bacterium]